MRYAKGPSGAARPRVATEALERRVLFAAELVAELHPGTLGSTPADSQSENLLGFEQAGGRVYYLASDGIHGDEIWSSDGTAAGSGMVADISPGAANTRLQQPRTAGGLLYFVRLADTPFGFRYELWRTNGTPAGTFRLRDVAGTTPTLPTESMGKLFYAAPVTGGNGYAVYATDGTVAGTTTVSSSPTPITAMDGTADELIFAADNSVYRYDGTPPVKLRAGTTLTSIFTMQGYAVVQQSTDTRPYALNTETGDLTLLSVGGRAESLTRLSDNRVAFSAGSRPWVTDGTPTGTRAIGVTGTPLSGGSGFAEGADGTVFFTAQQAATGYELYKMLPGTTGASIVSDISTGQGNSSSPTGMTAYRGRVYFAAYDPAHGRDLWSTDGTAAGTRLELELNPGTADARFGGFRVLGDRLLFLADPPMYGRELYQLDVNPAGAVTGYHVVSDANTLGASPDMSRAFGVTVGGRMFFVADDNLSGTGPELWVTDGTQAGTRLVEDVRPGPLGGTSLLVAYGDRLYFRGTESNAPASDGLWSSDGTAAGTRRVGTLGTVTSITPVGTKLFVGTSSQGLWVLDAPGAEPREVFSHAGGRFTSPQAPADVNGVLFFGARDGFNTGQVWRSDGTDAGSFPVGDFAQPTLDLSAGVAAAGKYFFINGDQAYATYGTADGMVHLSTTWWDYLVAGDDLVYLWNRFGGVARSDGTQAGTFQLGQVSVRGVATVGNRAFFDGTDGTTIGRELWTSDGTVAGTRLVKDIQPWMPSQANGDSDPTSFFAAGGGIFFSAANDAIGRELWRSDGTPAGTVLVADLGPGAGGSDPWPLGVLGDKFYFSADEPVHGREIWRIEAQPAIAAPTVTAVYVSGSGWSPTFKQALRDRGMGSADFGFAVPATDQLNELPWVNLNQVSVTFSGPVQVDASDLGVRGMGVANYTLDPAAFTYDPATRTATWRLAGAAFGADRILLDLDGDSPDGVRSPGGAFLDGDWINPVGPGPAGASNAAGGDAFPSGDGTAGGDFRFRVNVLPGDADRSGTVLADDFSQVKQKFFATPSSATYSVFHDLNGSGSILADDFSEVKRRFFTRLPDVTAAALLA